MSDVGGANQLSTQLWRQREVLELLLFKYEEENLLIAAGKTRWLSHAAREVARVVERLEEATLSLAVTVADVAAGWGLPQDIQLEELARKAPSPLWRELLTEHAVAMVGLIREIRGVRAAGVRQGETALTAGGEGVRRGPTTYTAAGRADYTTAIAHLIDANL